MSNFINIHMVVLFMLVLILAAFVMAFLVLLRGWRDESNIFYFLVMVILVFYGGSITAFEIAPTSEIATVFLHIYYATGTLLVLDLLYLAISFTHKEGVPIKTYIFFAIPALLLLGVDVSGQLFTVNPFNEGDLIKSFSYAPIYILMVFYVVLYCGASFLMVLKSYIESAGVFRQRSWNMSILIVVCVTIAALTNVILPLFSIAQFLFVGPYIISVGIFWFGFVIATYSLWNIKVFATEVFSFLLIVALFGNIAFGGSIEGYFAKVVFFILGSSAVVLLLSSVQNESESAEKVEVLMGEVARQHVRLEDLHARNTKFVIATANQLRDPLTGIRWHCSSLLSGVFGDIPENSREYVGRIFESTKRLLVIVDDFFDVRQIEQKNMPYLFSVFELRSTVKNVIEEEKPVSQHNNVTLSFSDDGLKKYRIKGDEGKVRQVISNLIDNAIKYSSNSAVKVSLHSEKNMVVVTVKDKGIGFYPDESEIIFEKFRRTGEAKKVATSGSGLGLYIAKSIVKIHKGTLTAESEGPGRGSTFRLELPMQPKGK